MAGGSNYVVLAAHIYSQQHAPIRALLRHAQQLPVAVAHAVQVAVPPDA